MEGFVGFQVPFLRVLSLNLNQINFKLAEKIIKGPCSDITRVCHDVSLVCSAPSALSFLPACSSCWTGVGSGCVRDCCNWLFK